mmetsp:Transcript_7944/g.10477  ORF Transcript_7944/g.10477 Transcript_7944/m.10477 type:complete len:1054 (-) Transcript_7944:139-3300(-)
MDGIEARLDRLRAQGAWGEVVPELQGYATRGAQLAAGAKALSCTHPTPNLARAYYWTVMAECKYRQKERLEGILQCIAKSLAYSASYRDCQILLAELLLFEGFKLPKESAPLKGFIPHSRSNYLGNWPPKGDNASGEDPWVLSPTLPEEKDTPVVAAEDDEGYETADEGVQNEVGEFRDSTSVSIGTVFTGLSEQELHEISKIFDGAQLPKNSGVLQMLQLVNHQAKLKAAKSFIRSTKQHEGSLVGIAGQGEVLGNFERLGKMIVINILVEDAEAPENDATPLVKLSHYRLGILLWSLTEKARLLEQTGFLSSAAEGYQAAFNAASSGGLLERPVETATPLSTDAFASLSPFCQAEVVIAASAAPSLYARIGSIRKAIEIYRWCLEPQGVIFDLLSDAKKVECAKHLAQLLVEESSPIEATRVLLDLYSSLYEMLTKSQRASRAALKISWPLTSSQVDAPQISQIPNSVNLNVFLDLCHAIVSHYLCSELRAPEAIDFLESLMSSALIPSHTLVVQWWDLADALVMTGKYRQALNALEECEKLLTSYTACQSFQTYYPSLKAAQICLDHAGDFHKAVQYSQHAIDLLQPGDEDPKVFYYHGVCLAELARHHTPFEMERKGLQNKAIASLQNAYNSSAELTSTRLHALAHQAILLGEMGKPGDAYACCQKGLAEYNSGLYQESEHSEKVMLLHIAALAIGCAEEDNYVEAERILHQAIEKVPGCNFNLLMSQASLALRLSPSAAPSLFYSLSERVNLVLRTYWGLEEEGLPPPLAIPDAMLVENGGGGTVVPQAVVLQPGDQENFEDTELQAFPDLIFEFWGLYISFLISRDQYGDATALLECAEKFVQVLAKRPRSPREETFFAKIKADISCQAGWVRLYQEDIAGAAEKLHLALMTSNHHVSAMVGLGVLNLQKISNDKLHHLSLKSDQPPFKQPTKEEFLPSKLEAPSGRDAGGTKLTTEEHRSSRSVLHWTEAYNFLVEAIRRDSSNGLAWHSLGSLFEKANMHVEAGESFLSAMEAEEQSSTRPFSCCVARNNHRKQKAFENSNSLYK